MPEAAAYARGILVSGYASIDFVWTVASPPRPNRTVLLTGSVEPIVQFGGCAPRVAVALAQAGHPVALVSWLGDDTHGNAYREYLERAGVDTTATVFASQQSSPRALLIYDPNGGATCCYHPTGSRQHTLDPRGVAQLEASTALILTVGPRALTEGLLAACPRGTRIAWGVKADADAYPVVLRRRLIQTADIISLNHDELAFVAEALEGVSASAGEEVLLARLRAATPAIIALTQGRQGVRVVWPAGDAQVAAQPVQVANPTGAGDVFLAGFVGRLLCGLAPEAAAAAATVQVAEFLRTTAGDGS